MKASDDDYPRVMGPGASKFSPTSSINHPPMFTTNCINKANYRDSVAKWTTLLRFMSSLDPKDESHLRSVGIMLYLGADEETKVTIKNA